MVVDAGIEAGGTPTGLADQLKARTWDLHREAERSGVLNALLRGHADRGAYVLLLRNLVPVYAALERALMRRADAPLLRGIARPELYRSEALRSDLGALAGGAWTGEIVTLPSAALYAARIDAAEGDDGLLTAHAYVRYLGDLNGGQILRRLLGKTLGLSPHHLAFYEFGSIADPEAFSTAFRSAVDHLGEHIGDREAVLREAVAAFQLNIDLSNAVEHEARQSPARADNPL